MEGSRTFPALLSRSEAAYLYRVFIRQDSTRRGLQTEFKQVSGRRSSTAPRGSGGFRKAVTIFIEPPSKTAHFLTFSTRTTYQRNIPHQLTSW